LAFCHSRGQDKNKYKIRKKQKHVALVNNIKHTEVCALNRKKNKKIESDRFPHLIKIGQAANTIIVSYRRTQKKKKKNQFNYTQFFVGSNSTLLGKSNPISLHLPSSLLFSHFFGHPFSVYTVVLQAKTR
jgi:hypothetical protein